MVKKEEKETPEVETPEVETPEVVTPTAEEQLAALQKERDELAKERDEATKGLKTAHSKLTEKDKEIRKQADLRAEVDELKELQKIGFALMTDQGRIPEEGLEPEKRQELSKVFDTKVSELDRKRELREVQAKMAGYQERTESLGLTTDDPEYWDIEDAVTNLKFQRAEALLKRIEKSKEAEKATDTKGDKVESEEERINKLVDEKLLQKMKEKGMLESETGGPSGASLNDEQIRENYRENPNDPKAYQDYKAYVARKRGF